MKRVGLGICFLRPCCATPSLPGTLQYGCILFQIEIPRHYCSCTACQRVQTRSKHTEREIQRLVRRSTTWAIFENGESVTPQSTLQTVATKNSRPSPRPPFNIPYPPGLATNSPSRSIRVCKGFERCSVIILLKTILCDVRHHPNPPIAPFPLKSLFGSQLLDCTDVHRKTNKAARVYMSMPTPHVHALFGGYW